MRTLTAQEERIYSLPDRGVRLRVWIADSGGTPVDIDTVAGGPWLLGAEWGEDIDSPTATATILLRNTSDLNMLSPLATMARQSGTVYLRREVVIEVAIIPPGATPSAWVEMFRGQVDSISWAGANLEISCRDNVAILQDTFIEVPDAYSDALGNPVEDVMQDILDATMGVGVVTLYTPTSPSWSVTEFATTQQGVLDQLTLLSDQIGWFLRYKWDSGTSTFRLTFYEPDRSNTTYMYRFGPDRILAWQALDLAIDDIRNVCMVTFGDTSALDASGQPTPTTETAEDAGSIALYGRRTAMITEDATSNIDSSTEAAALAVAVVSDLATPVAIASVDVPFFHAVELGDLYRFDADNYHIDGPTDLAVAGYRHTVRDGQVRTSLQVRGGVASGGRARWLVKEGRPGVSPIQQTVGPQTTTAAATAGAGTIELGLELWKNRGMAMDRYFEVHAGSAGFAAERAAGSTTIIGRYSQLTRAQLQVDLYGRIPIGEIRDVVMFPLDHLGNAGDEIRISDAIANRLGTHFLAESQRFAGSFFGGVYAFQARGTGYPPDGWHMVTGAWGVDLDLDDGAVYSTPETGAYALTLKNTSVATRVKSDKVPVTHGRRYHWQASVRASSAAYAVKVGVEWLDSSETVLSTDYLQNGALAASGTWTPLRMTASSPSSAVFARFFVEKAASAFYVSIDKLLWEEYDPTVESLVHRVCLRDDFAGGNDDDRIGDLGWGVTFLGADVSSITSVGAARAPSATGSFDWTRLGVVQVTTPSSSGGALSGYGTLIAIGDGANPVGYGLPPQGVECRCRVQISSGTTEIQVWLGMWSNTTTLPDPGLANSITGVGWSLRSTVSATNWYGITRSGTTETLVDLGVASTSGWVELGWRRTSAGIQFFVDGVDVGSEVTTNLPSSSDPQTPVIGVATTNASAKVVDVDTFLLVGDVQR